MALTLLGVARAQDLPPASLIDLQTSVEQGQYLEPDYLSFPVYVTVTNLGPDTATDVTVSITLPAFLSGQPLEDAYGCHSSGGSVECPVPRLEAGAYAVVAVGLFPPPEPFGAFEVTATSKGSGVDRVPENNQATLSTRGPGRLRLAGAGCSSVTWSGAPLGSLVLLLALLRARCGSRRTRGAGSKLHG